MNLKDYFPKKPPTPEEFITFLFDMVVNELAKENEPLHTTDQCRGEYYSPVDTQSPVAPELDHSDPKQ